MSVSRHVLASVLFVVCLFFACFVAEASAGELPSRVDLRPQYEAWNMSIENQGARSTCSLHVIANLVEYELARIEGQRQAPLSEEYLLWATTEACGLQRRDGAMFFHILFGLNSLGVCSEGNMPNAVKFDPDYLPSPEAREDALSRRGWTANWIKRWDNRTGLTEEQIVAAKEALAQGTPVGVGMLWPNKILMSPLHVMEVPTSRRQVHDGHSVTLVGYHDNETYPGGGAFLVRNTHSIRWGMEGYGWFPYDYLMKYANDALTLERGLEEVAGTDAFIAFEAEDCAPRSIEKELLMTRQNMMDFGSNLWSGGHQIYFQDPQQGDTFEFTFNVDKAGEYRIDLALTQAPDYGRVQARLNNADPAEFDLFGPRVMPTGPMTLGSFTLQPGPQTLRLTVVGKNPRANDFGFGFDAIRLLPLVAQEKTAPEATDASCGGETAGCAKACCAPAA